jgi:hypothetical protein
MDGIAATDARGVLAKAFDVPDYRTQAFPKYRQVSGVADQDVNRFECLFHAIEAFLPILRG